MEEISVSKDLYVYIDVLFPLPLEEAYTYVFSPTRMIDRGSFVRASFRGRSCVGMVWKKWGHTPDIKKEGKKIKEIEDVLSLPPFSEKFCAFIDWVSRYTLSPLGSVLKLAMGEPTLFKPILKRRNQEEAQKFSMHLQRSFQLTQEQENVVKQMRSYICLETFSVTLLDGVTGSGKTEVYFELIEDVLKKKGQVLVLLPEISLGTQWIKRFKDHFGFEPFMWHSDIKASSRRVCWRGVAQDIPCVVVGARSALFLPFAHLQLIVVDEEHDMSFKQEEGVLYHARDMAIVRAKLEKIPVLLASATPSLETRLNAKSGRFHSLTLAHRAQTAQLPDIETIDMRLYGPHLKRYAKSEGKIAFLSPPLRQALLENFERHEQSLLFLNRRGYAPLMLCRGCGLRFSCPHCSAWLVLHHVKSSLMCHHCGYTLPSPKICPTCHQENTLAACGPGVERIYEEVLRIIPEARVLLLSSDTLESVQKVRHTIEMILKGEADILIGTQVVSKGHHFPNLTLVGVVDADLGLSGGDLRASEKTYQVLHQVSGRSGREKKTGRVLLQTFCPEHRVMKALLSGDRERFFDEEEQERRLAQMPPFGKLAALIVTSHKAPEVESIARALGRAAPMHPDVMILGPVPAPLFQLGKRYRWRFLIKASKEAPLHRIIESWLRSVKIPKTVKIHVDIDPYRFL